MADAGSMALILSGSLDALVALLHVAIIFGGGPWYRFFGAGERMAVAAEAGRLWPAAVTALIVLVFTSWAVYAFSGAGLLPPLPVRKPVLAAVASIYLVRGVLFAPLLLRIRPRTLVLWSSAASAGIGAVHLLGLMQAWPAL